ncbi:exodeoxyribonuclease VII large subunit [Nitratifractor sp.]|uniref:exodeoxyribonuclease VII large subunit n=1 Tax=Nitratifractor sp. TaxID=2268144 RepID=UPI0025E58224|nr:exodeoxyribonuclease VII large subunit [Nitratifractor sp.]
MQLMSVSSLNEKIKSLLEATFLHIRVEGEIASVTYHSSGHIYFSVKDERSSLRCVMWRSNASRLKFRLEKGEHIVLEGSIGVYTPRGEYQLIAVHVEPYGRGALALAFEQLKKKLEAQGYFAQERKKSLPKFPRHIVLVTAAGGAALQDMLKVAAKRWPLARITVVDVLVQGEAAAAEIARGIAVADRLGADLIVTGRGGGSVEDLWAFNEELVADAIFAAKTPVVSAVGHEVDTLISDFVADLRAPTPSAAMEMVLPDRNELLWSLDETMEGIRRRTAEILHRKEEALLREREAMRRASVLARLQRISESFERLGREYSDVMHYRLSRFEVELPSLRERMRESEHRVLERKESTLRGLSEQARRLDPRLRSREGWAELTREGRRIALESLKEGETFELSDARVKVTATCLKKAPLR